jgi:hypothetical protein
MQRGYPREAMQGGLLRQGIIALFFRGPSPLGPVDTIAAQLQKKKSRDLLKLMK